jgi:hypothetical protein
MKGRAQTLIIITWNDFEPLEAAKGILRNTGEVGKGAGKLAVLHSQQWKRFKASVLREAS